MLNIVLSFLVSHLVGSWLVFCAIAGLACLFMPILRTFAIKNWLPLAVVAAIVLVSLIVMQDTRRITDLTAQLNDQKAQTEELSGSITGYTSQLDKLEKAQTQIRKDITAARKGLDAATLVKESVNDPVKASSDTTDRWNALNSMFDEATGGEPVRASSAASTSANSNTTGTVENP